MVTTAVRLRWLRWLMVSEAAELQRGTAIELGFDGTCLEYCANLIRAAHKCVDQLIKVGIEVA